MRAARASAAFTSATAAARRLSSPEAVEYGATISPRRTASAIGACIEWSWSRVSASQPARLVTASSSR